MQILEAYVDLLDKAIEYLRHLTAWDHCRVIKYLIKVPVLNNITMAIISGHAGVGKTFFIGEVYTTILRADSMKKILIVMLSNELYDLVVCKIKEGLQAHLET